MDEKIKSGLLAGIEEKIVWTTADGNTWKSLEDAMAHQRRRQIINAIMEMDDNLPTWLFTQRESIAGYAEELFQILAPFFEPLTPAPEQAPAAKDRAEAS